MERPKDIPQDVWQAAQSEAAQYVEWLIPKPEEYRQSEYVLAVSLSRAILAERERCAKVAYVEAVKHCSARDGQTLIGHPVGHSIAAAIRGA